MKKIAGALLLLALFLPALAAAQGPGTPMAAPPTPPTPPGGPDLGKWWKNSEIARELGLSDAQTNQIEQTFLDFRLKLIDLRADLEKQETRLQPLIEADQPDESKVGAQIDQVLAARGRLEKANAMMMLSIRRVLSVEQWKKLQTIKEKRERRMGDIMHQRVPGPEPFGPAPGMFERQAPPPPEDRP